MWSRILYLPPRPLLPSRSGIIDARMYKDEEDDEDMEFGSVNLDDLEIPERFGWEDDL